MLVVHKRTIFDLAVTLGKRFYWFLKADKTDLLSEYTYIYIYALIFFFVQIRAKTISL